MRYLLSRFFAIAIPVLSSAAAFNVNVQTVPNPPSPGNKGQGSANVRDLQQSASSSSLPSSIVSTADSVANKVQAVPFFLDVLPSDSVSASTLSSSSSSIVSVQQQPQEAKILGFRPSRQFTPFQLFARFFPLATFATYLVIPERFDEAVSRVWEAIYNSPVAHVPLFEADVASFGFFLWISLFSSLHLFLGEDRTRANRLDGDLPHDPFEWAKPTSQSVQLWFNPLFGYLGSIWLYHQFIHDKAPLPVEAPTFGVLCGELLFGIWLYDLLFYPLHYLYHSTTGWASTLMPGWVKRSHGYHHRSGRFPGRSLNSLETVQHTYVDAFLQVGVNILVQNISPFGVKHTLSRLLHNLMVTYLLSEAHSGYDMEFMSHRIWPEFLGGSVRHEQHHHDGKVYYHQFFMYLDDAFGFVKQKDKESAAASRNG